MESWLKSGTSKPKESNGDSNNDKIESNEINEGKPSSIMKKTCYEKARKVTSMTKNILNRYFQVLELKGAYFT